MWFDSKDEPNSMEALIAKQLCKDPAQVYADEQAERTPIVLEEEKVIEDEEVKEED